MIEIKKNNFFLNEEVNTILKKIIKNKSFTNGYLLMVIYFVELKESERNKLLYDL